MIEKIQRQAIVKITVLLILKAIKVNGLEKTLEDLRKVANTASPLVADLIETIPFEDMWHDFKTEMGGKL